MPKKELQKNTNVILFEEKKIRKIWKKDRWYFAVADVVQILTDSKNVTD